MNVNFQPQADQTAFISVMVSEADYAENVDKALRAHRRKAQIPGYRPGMVPMGIINKMYRRGAVAEQTYRMATDEAFKYVKESKLDIIGDMMPADIQSELDFDNGKDFEFVFHVGIAPQIKLDLTKEDKIEKYIVVPSEDMVSGYRENFLRRFGKLVDVDVVEKDEALNVTLSNDDMTIEDAYVGLISFGEAERTLFIGKKVGDTMEVDINELYKEPKQRAAILDVKEEDLEGLNPKFKLEITKIRAFRNPELDGEFFAQAYPDGSVADVAAFEADVLKKVNDELVSQTEFHITDQVRKYLLSKLNLTLPEEFLKNWLFQINEGKFTMEQIEAEFPAFLDMMRWDLVKREIAVSHKLEINEEDALSEAKSMAMMQFRYYGMNQAPEDLLENYARRILENKEEAKKIYERVGERKVVDAVVEIVTTVPIEVSLDEFQQKIQ
ncbi:Cell division trigger factor [Mucinivorans hirudinis]|uniref:Cell division trigger factor n=1 Tax=Mucinivorans hirudinis TaxID=1433126 RepID=A0A060RBE3_9BACT|nr:Cell division trigger factor [Mucinivorans hirudinis]